MYSPKLFDFIEANRPQKTRSISWSEELRNGEVVYSPYVFGQNKPPLGIGTKAVPLPEKVVELPTPLWVGASRSWEDSVVLSTTMFVSEVSDYLRPFINECKALIKEAKSK